MLTAFNPFINIAAFRELFILLTRHRQLTIEMAKREIADRYSGQVFGLLWAFGHPLTVMLVYVFIFRFVFSIKIGGTVEMPLDYSAYLLSGLIPWLAFSETMNKACTVVASNATLVKQVIFPLEVLPVKGSLATLATAMIFFLLLLSYIVLALGIVPWTFLLLPVLIFLQVLAMIGVSYTLSAIGVFFRDIKDFVQVFSVIGVYLMPAFYLPSLVPPFFRPFLYLNPFSYMIWCFQDLIYFGRIEHRVAWIVFPIMSLVVFVLGYRIFRKLRPLFANVL
ncbi:MAG: ABC transporter permease [Acidobacteriota bacterium]|jgi:lipopolysaccharide transport system permease protein